MRAPATDAVESQVPRAVPSPRNDHAIARGCPGVPEARPSSPLGGPSSPQQQVFERLTRSGQRYSALVEAVPMKTNLRFKRLLRAAFFREQRVAEAAEDLLGVGDDDDATTSSASSASSALSTSTGASSESRGSDPSGDFSQYDGDFGEDPEGDGPMPREGHSEGPLAAPSYEVLGPMAPRSDSASGSYQTWPVGDFLLGWRSMLTSPLR